MKLVAILMLIALPAQAAEPTPLAFSARIQREALAEEAIDLLHCLADRLELPWELSEESKSAYSLKLEEKAGQLEGSFQTPAVKKEIRFGKGEAARVCGELIEMEEEKVGGPALPTENWELEKSKPGKWLWIAGAAAVVAGGFLLWKSRPDHKSFTMQ